MTFELTMEFKSQFLKCGSKSYLISAVKAACLTYDFKPYHESSNLKYQNMVVSLFSIFKLPASSFTLVMGAQI